MAQILFQSTSQTKPQIHRVLANRCPGGWDRCRRKPLSMRVLRARARPLWLTEGCELGTEESPGCRASSSRLVSSLTWVQPPVESPLRLQNRKDDVSPSQNHHEDSEGAQAAREGAARSNSNATRCPPEAAAAQGTSHRGAKTLSIGDREELIHPSLEHEGSHTD